MFKVGDKNLLLEYCVMLHDKKVKQRKEENGDDYSYVSVDAVENLGGELKSENPCMLVRVTHKLKYDFDGETMVSYDSDILEISKEKFNNFIISKRKDKINKIKLKIK